jgi:hypothetical protein
MIGRAGGSLKETHPRHVALAMESLRGKKEEAPLWGASNLSRNALTSAAGRS